MSGTLITAFALQKFATARYWLRGALIVFFWTAIALFGRILLPAIAGWRSPAGLLRATAFCSRQNLTTRVLGEKLTPENWSFARWLAERWRGGVNRLSALLHLPLGPLRRIRQRVWQGARSCNLAIWRSDLDRVDGFDADYSGWGKEDSDIIVRLLHAGIRRKDGVFATGVLHLWHAEANRSQLSENERKLAEVVSGNRVRAERGLSSLQGAPATTMAAS